MTARNDVTGDAIKTGSSSDAYRDGWDLAFKKDWEEWVDPDDAPELTEEWVKKAVQCDGEEDLQKWLAECEDKKELYDQWQIDAENTKRLNELTQDD